MLRYALIALAVLGALTGLVLAWNSYTDGLIEEGYSRGRAEVLAEVATRDKAQMDAVLAELASAQAKVKAAERKAREELAAVAAKHKVEMKNAEDRTEKLVADARAGALVLRDPGGRSAGPAGGGERAEGDAGSAPRGAGQAGRPELSVEAASFLLELTGEADMLAFRYNRLLSAYKTAEELCRGD